MPGSPDLLHMGINLGAFFGSLFVPIVAAKFGWNIGFALPAIGMLLEPVSGFRRHAQVTLGDAGVAPPGSAARGLARGHLRRHRRAARCAGVHRQDEVRSGAGPARRELGDGGTRRGLLRRAYLLWFAGLDRAEHNRVWAMPALFVGCDVLGGY